MNVVINRAGGLSTARCSRLEGFGGWSLGERRFNGIKQDRQASFLPSLIAAIEACELRDGAVVSFHHHFRNGDRVVVDVVKAMAELGLRGLTIAASSLFPAQEALLPLIHDGVIGKIITDYARGAVADAIIQGDLPQLCVLQSHGGRARAIVSGELPIDATFIGAPLAHVSGATTGRGGTLACGPLGYAMVDAAHAAKTVVLADKITADPLAHIDIPAEHVDYVVAFPRPGDPLGIQSGSTLVQTTPTALMIADTVRQVIKAMGLIAPGFAFQTGAGGYSLAAVAAIGEELARSGMVANYVSGGITGAHVALLEQGLVHRIRDVQSFDLAAVRSSMTHHGHQAMSAAEYASPDRPDAAVEGLSAMILGAGEVDLDFNVNVTLGGDGRMIGGPGGHPDAAQGARLAIVTTTLTGGGFPKIVKNAACVTTPGNDIDVVVTDEGVAVNPARPDIAERLKDAHIAMRPIEALHEDAGRRSQRTRVENQGRPVAVIENRKGGALDVILSS